MTARSVVWSRRLKIASAGGLFVALVCSAPLTAMSQGAVPVAANAARIYFYQDGSPSDGLGIAVVRLNGAQVGQTQTNSGFYRDVTPGHYHISLDNPVTDLNQSADIDLAPGQVAYIKIATLDNWDSSGGRKSGGSHTTFYVWPMPPAMGRSDVAHIPAIHG